MAARVGFEPAALRHRITPNAQLISNVQQQQFSGFERYLWESVKLEAISWYSGASVGYNSILQFSVVLVHRIFVNAQTDVFYIRKICPNR